MFLHIKRFDTYTKPQGSKIRSTYLRTITVRLYRNYTFFTVFPTPPKKSVCALVHVFVVGYICIQKLKERRYP